MVGHGSPEDSADGLAYTKDDDEGYGGDDTINYPVLSRDSVALRIALAVVQIIFHNCCILIFVGCSFIALLKSGSGWPDPALSIRSDLGFNLKDNCLTI